MAGAHGTPEVSENLALKQDACRFDLFCLHGLQRVRLSKIARYTGWWRNGSIEDGDDKKGTQSLVLASALISEEGETVYADFQAALKRCYETKVWSHILLSTFVGVDSTHDMIADMPCCYQQLDATYREFLSSSRAIFDKAPPLFLAAHMSDVIL